MNFFEQAKALFSAASEAQESFSESHPTWELSFLDYNHHLDEFRIYLDLQQDEDRTLQSIYGLYISEKGLFIKNESHLRNPALHPVFQSLETALGMTIQNWSK